MSAPTDDRLTVAPRPPVEVRAVLWDLDGTLVDTEPSWMEAERDIVEAFGASWSEEHARALIGNDLRTSAAYLKAHAAIDRDIDEIVDWLVSEMVGKVRGGVDWRPGARDLLAELRMADIPTALVTMSYRPLAAAVLDQLPPGSFLATVTGDEVVRGKPHPAPYLEAARRLGVDPESCVVIEDSPTGMASGIAAGCHVVGVRNLVDLSPGPGRTIIDSLHGVGFADLQRWAAVC